MMPFLRQALPLYWVLGPRDDDDIQVLSASLRQGIRGGVSMVQWRDKKKQVKAQQLQVIRDICHQCHVPFLVNDDVAMALKVQADGVHLGQDDMHPTKARALLGAKAIIGLSVGNDKEAMRYDPQTVNYVGVGPLYHTATKKDAGQPLGWLKAIRLIERNALSNAVFIGGISAQLLANEKDKSHSKHLAGFAVAGALDKAANIEQSAGILLKQISLRLHV